MIKTNSIGIKQKSTKPVTSAKEKQETKSTSNPTISTTIHKSLTKHTTNIATTNRTTKASGQKTTTTLAKESTEAKDRYSTRTEKSPGMSCLFDLFNIYRCLLSFLN